MQLIFDVEGDGLEATKLWCMSCNIDGTVRSTTRYKKMKEVFSRATVLIGHNITRWDVPAIERILDIKIEAKIIDTLALSWYLYPDRILHGLGDWGEEFGVPKPKIDDWFNLTVEEYVHRCEEDVKINTKLWNKQWKYLVKLYGSEEEAWRLIDYLSFKLDCAREQERSRWKLDVDKCKQSLESLRIDHSKKSEVLASVMPKVAKKAIRKRPSAPYKKDGTLSVAGAKWFSLLKKNSLPEDYEGEVEQIVSYEEPNPNSTLQIKNWLYSLGWVPETFKYNRDKITNDIKKVEQVRKEVDGAKELCPSVKKLFSKEPNLVELEGITVLEHRIGILKGFLENVDDEGYVKAEIAGLTNTLRFKHRVCVNLPGVNKPYGDIIRGCLIAPEGYELCGSDMSSLEDRTKQHYMWPYDPDYVREMNTPDFDPHLDLGVMARMITPEQSKAYKSGDKACAPVRHEAKQVNYSCTYGVTPAGIVRNTGMKLSNAERLHTTFWQRNWSIKAIADDCTVKTVNQQKWLYNPVSKLWYTLRHDKDKFSTLNQGTGTYCFDRWVYWFRTKRPQLTGQFHDEVVLCIKKGFRKKAESLLKWSIGKVNEELKLDRELDVDVQFGDKYADIH